MLEKAGTFVKARASEKANVFMKPRVCVKARAFVKVIVDRLIKLECF